MSGILDWILGSATPLKGVMFSLSIGDLLKFGGVAAGMWTLVITQLRNVLDTKIGVVIAKLNILAAFLFWSGILVTLFAGIRDFKAIAPYLIDLSCTMYIMASLSVLAFLINLAYILYRELTLLSRLERTREKVIKRKRKSCS